MNNNWSIFHKFDGSHPKEFFEIRYFEYNVLISYGETLTLGETELTVCGNEEDARSMYNRICASLPNEGYALSRELLFDPSTVDFDLLTEEIREAARKAFTEVRESHKEETINCYALFSDESAMTIGHLANSREALELTCQSDDIVEALELIDHSERIEIVDDIRWNSQEWSFSVGDEHFDIPYRMILAMDSDIPYNTKYGELVSGIFESAVSALEQLDSDGFFGEGVARNDVILLFQVSDSDEVEGAAERLNTPEKYLQYRKWRNSGDPHPG